MFANKVRASVMCACALALAAGIPAALAQDDVRVWATAAASGPSFLGVGVKEIDSERAKELKLREEAGVEITRVEDDSPAATAGLKVGDAVLQFNGQRVEGIEQFSRFVRETPPGREVRLLISRGGSTQTITAKIGQRKNMIVVPSTSFEMPRIEMPPMPDIPHAMMMSRSGMLGIEAEPLRGQLADFFGVKEGVLVRQVNKDSAAEKAGVKAGDVILRINDQKVATPSEIGSALRAAARDNKKTVPLVIVRDHKETTLTATVESDNENWAPRARPAVVRPARPVKM